MNAVQLLTHFHRLAEAPDAAPRLRRFILDLAVRGKLVDRNPSDEPAVAVGISKIAAECGPPRTKGNRADDGFPYQLPSSWAWRRLEAISDQITDGEHATPQRIDEKQVPLITARNVRDGFMDFTVTDWVSCETATTAWKRCRPTLGDILLVCVGATTGRLCILREPKDMVLVRSVALIRPSSGIEVDYIALALRSPTSQAQIWEKVKMTAQPCLCFHSEPFGITLTPIRLPGC
jgi:type I restriction enzyme, S subunit